MSHQPVCVSVCVLPCSFVGYVTAPFTCWLNTENKYQTDNGDRMTLRQNNVTAHQQPAAHRQTRGAFKFIRTFVFVRCDQRECDANWLTC